MAKKKVTNQTTLRFRTLGQRDLIYRAAKKEDTSVNSFLRRAAEKEARLVLGASAPAEEPSLAAN